MPRITSFTILLFGVFQISVNYVPFQASAADKNWIPLNGPYGGYAFGIAIDPVDPDYLYVGTLGGGLYQSKDGGLSWNRSRDGIQHLDIYHIAIDPNNPSVVYASAIFRVNSEVPEKVIYKSMDKGQTWDILPLFINGKGAVLATQTDPSVLLVGDYADNGVFRSTDGGDNFDNTLPNLSISELVSDPLFPSVIYAATSDYIYKSPDAGKSWVQIRGDLPDPRVISISVSSTDSSILFCATSQTAYKSIDAGETWKPILTTMAKRIRTARSNSNVVWLVGQDSMLSTIPAVYYSDDCGENFSFITVPTQDQYYAPFANDIAIHPDHENIVYVSFYRAGVLRTTDAGNSWEITKLPSVIVSAINVDPNHKEVILVGTDQSGVWLTIDGGLSWQKASTGFSGVNKSTYAFSRSSEDPNLILMGARQGLYYSEDSGKSWTHFLEDTAEVYDVDFSLSNPSIAWAGATYGIYGAFKSTDGGKSWDLTPLLSKEITSIAIHPTEPDIVFCAWMTTFPPTAGIDLTRDGGITWQVLYDNQAGHLYFRNLTVDPSNPNILYATGAGMDSHSLLKIEITEQGTNVIPHYADFNALKIMDFKIDPNNHQHFALVCHDGGGYFESFDSGLNWAQDNTGLWQGYQITLTLWSDTNGHTYSYLGAYADGIYIDFDIRKELGETCIHNEQCKSHYCVDGICCDTACGEDNTNDCLACGTAAGAKTNGTCHLLESGTLCRNSKNLCDLEEYCDGINTECPEDVFIENCCIQDSECDDQNPCTKDQCDPQNHICINSALEECTHDSQDGGDSEELDNHKINGVSGCGCTTNDSCSCVFLMFLLGYPLCLLLRTRGSLILG